LICSEIDQLSPTCRFGRNYDTLVGQIEFSESVSNVELLISNQPAILSNFGNIWSFERIIGIDSEIQGPVELSITATTGETDIGPFIFTSDVIIGLLLRLDVPVFIFIIGHVPCVDMLCLFHHNQIQSLLISSPQISSPPTASITNWRHQAIPFISTSQLTNCSIRLQTLQTHLIASTTHIRTHTFFATV
jgi:hypothetical protein